MKLTTLALALSITVSGLAQESGKAADPACSNPNTICAPANSVKWNDPDYIGVVHHKSHKLRNILIGTGIAAGVGVAIVLTHSGTAASHGSSGNYPANPVIPSVVVFK
jgi:hypothetical protein